MGGHRQPRQPRLQLDRELPGRAQSRRLDYHRPVLRVHRGGRGDCVGRVELRGGDAGQDQGDADPSRPSQRRAANRSGVRLELQRGWDCDQPGGIELHRERHLRVRLHRERPQAQRAGFCRRARLDGVPALRKARRLQQSQSARPARQARVYGDLVAAGPHAERLPAPRVQRDRKRQEGLRRPHAMDRRGQRHQHELPLLAVQPYRAQPPEPFVHRRPLPVRERDDARSDHA